MWICEHIDACTYVCRYTWRPKEGARFSAVIDGCEPPIVGAGKQTQVL